MFIRKYFHTDLQNLWNSIYVDYRMYIEIHAKNMCYFIFYFLFFGIEISFILGQVSPGHEGGVV